jgi:NAD(P)-dependent dehydrogenase (short-subunit alcohol dehydrogenase family)
MRGLRDKVALVAGAAPGNIGTATAVRLAEEGTTVVSADLNESAARAVADEIQALGGKAIARSFDITDEASYKQLVEDTVNEFGRLDGLCAGHCRRAPLLLELGWPSRALGMKQEAGER